MRIERRERTREESHDVRAPEEERGEARRVRLEIGEVVKILIAGGEEFAASPGRGEQCRRGSSRCSRLYGHGSRLYVADLDMVVKSGGV